MSTFESMRKMTTKEQITFDMGYLNGKADAVVHARWIICSDGYYPYCSACKAEPKSRELTNYCPNCGAKMDGFAAALLMQDVVHNKALDRPARDKIREAALTLKEMADEIKEDT